MPRSCTIGPNNMVVTAANFRRFFLWRGPVPDAVVNHETVAIYVTQVAARRARSREYDYVSHTGAPDTFLDSALLREFWVHRGNVHTGETGYGLTISSNDVAAVKAVLARG